MNPIQLQLQNYYTPLGIDTPEPIFSWQLKSKGRGQRQTRYQIIVERAGQPGKERELLWDSGQVLSSKQMGIRYAGQPLQSLTSYTWKVGVWNQEDCESWSEPAPLVTAYLQPDSWRGVWIGSGSAKPLYLRREFEVKGPVQRAFVLVSGLGHFKLHANGRKVGTHEMDPGWTAYDSSIQYVCLDLSDYLVQGRNALGISLGNGFYAGDDGGRHFYVKDKGYQPYGSELMSICECHIEYTNGVVEQLYSDDSWLTRESATKLANVYGSEDYDARTYPHGWDQPGYEDKDWVRAQRLAPPDGKLVCQNQPPVIVKQVYQTIAVDEPKPGVYVFDLGQNMSGLFEIYVSGPSGSTVTVKPGELRHPDGTIAAPWDIDTHSRYTLAGEGIETWRPDFSCAGARWVQIEGCTRDGADPDKPVIHEVKGCFVTSAAADSGGLETDDPRIGRLAEIITKAIESNLQSVHTDCPTIEKLGWIETAHLMGPSIMYVKHVEQLWLKIVRDMIEAQTDEGLVPDIAPEYSRFEGGFRDSIAWGGALVLVPAMLDEMYGTQTAIHEAYPAMRRYMSYLKARETDIGFIGHGLGDWGIAPQTGGDYIENVETALYYHLTMQMVQHAELLGEDEDADFYRLEAEKIRQVYNTRLLAPVRPDDSYAYCKLDGTYDALNQVMQAMPLALGLVPDEQRNDVEEALLEATASRQLRSGEIGLRYLFRALADMGRHDIVFDMMMQPEHPSYIRFVDQGETALPEFWTDDARSRNHDMMGHILEWLYKDLLGISSVVQAFGTIRIAPFYSERVRQIRGTHHSVRGPISVTFGHDDRAVTLEVKIPANTSARVRIPLPWPDSELTESGRVCSGPILIEGDTRYVEVETGSGHYSYQVRRISRD